MVERVELSQADLLRQFHMQVAFLCRSSAAFDQGYEDEAFRLATTIRLMLHNTSQSKSLLRQLGIQDNTLYRDTCKFAPEMNVRGPFDGLTGMVFSGGGKANPYPLLDRSPLSENCLREFGDWWNQVVVRDNNGAQFTRRDLVLFMSNQDGGAHVDPTIDAKYAELTRGNSMDWTMEGPEGNSPITAPHISSVRQITHELLTGLAKTNPEMEILASYNNLDFSEIPLGCAIPNSNDPCPCKSGETYNNCHLRTQERYAMNRRQPGNTVFHAASKIVVKKYR